GTPRPSAGDPEPRTYQRGMGMRMLTTIKRGVLAAASIALLATGATVSAQDKEVTIQMTSTWPPGINLIETDKHFVELVNKLGKGVIQIKFHPGESLVPSTQVFDAVRSGSIDASADWPGYWGGTDTAFALLGAFPMFFTGADYVLWIQGWDG